MGKVDDMRRLREEQHAQQSRARVAAAPVVAKAAGAAPVVAAPADVDPVEDAMVPKRAKVPAAASSKKAAVSDDVGTCSSCGKAKPMQRGVIANHQKGLGKMCPGSRKPPA